MKIDKFLKNSKNFIYIFVGILFLLGIGFILFQNKIVKHRLTKKQNQCLRLKQDLAKQKMINQIEYRYTGVQFPVASLKHLNSDDHYKTQFTQTTLVVLFTDFDCGSCVKTTLSCIDSLYKSKAKKCSIIGVTNSKKQQSVYKNVRALCSFPIYNDVDGAQSIFHRLELKNSPTLFLVSENKNKIIYAQQTTSDKQLIQDLFKKIDLWLH